MSHSRFPENFLVAKVFRQGCDGMWGNLAVVRKLPAASDVPAALRMVFWDSLLWDS